MDFNKTSIRKSIGDFQAENLKNKEDVDSIKSFTSKNKFSVLGSDSEEEGVVETKKVTKKNQVYRE